MLIPSDLVPEWLTSPNYPQLPVETQEQALAGQELPILQAPKPDVTAWPVDAPRPPFAVGSVYTFADMETRSRMLEACRQFAVGRASALRNGAA